MKNVADTETYTVFDHVLSKTVRSLSHVVGLRKITQPFWARWLASGIRPEVIFQFLDELRTIDGWATAAGRIVSEQIRRAQDLPSSLQQGQRAEKLREQHEVVHLVRHRHVLLVRLGARRRCGKRGDEQQRQGSDPDFQVHNNYVLGT